MNAKLHELRMILRTAAAVAVLGLIAAMPTPAAGNSVTMTVTAVGKKKAAPRISPSDVLVHEGKDKARMQVVDWRRGETLYLAILIDDGVDNRVAVQLNDIRDFIREQPSTTYVAVAYARNGTAQIAQDFTKDHAKAGKALRIPLGDVGALGSPYLSLQDLIHRMPKGERRAIVLVSSGIDYFRGDFGPFSPDLDTTIERAQRENVTLYAMYAPGAGRRSRFFFRVNNAQASLSKLGDETGGAAFYLGFDQPVTFKPYLDEIRTYLDNQYLLTFRPERSPKDRFENVKVGTEVPAVRFLAAPQVYVRKS